MEVFLGAPPIKQLPISRGRWGFNSSNMWEPTCHQSSIEGRNFSFRTSLRQIGTLCKKTHTWHLLHDSSSKDLPGRSATAPRVPGVATQVAAQGGSFMRRKISAKRASACKGCHM